MKNIKTKINARIIADSINEYGDRITTYVLTYPRIIHAELLTHRMFSRNAASSRAIPYKKLCEAVKTDTFVPIAWQKDHKGMQGADYHTGFKVKVLNTLWKMSMRCAVFMSNILSKFNATKQLCNRLLEPYQWYTSIVTATDYDNFFELRSPQYVTPVEGKDDEGNDIIYKSKKDVLKAHSNESNLEMMNNFTNIDWLKLNKGQAEIHLMELAECMWDAKNESKPVQLKQGEWHIPFGDNIDIVKLGNYLTKNDIDFEWDQPNEESCLINAKIKIATARCARVSYTVVGEEGKEANYDNDIKLHDRLFKSGHFSPFEHCARAMKYEERFDRYGDLDDYSGNFKGFVQYRKILEEPQRQIIKEEPLILTRYNLDK